MTQHTNHSPRSHCYSGPSCSWAVYVWSTNSWQGTFQVGKLNPLPSSTLKCVLWPSSATWNQVWPYQQPYYLPCLPCISGNRFTFFYREYPPHLPVSSHTGPQGTLWGLYPLTAKSICVCVGHCESLGPGHVRICGSDRILGRKAFLLHSVRNRKAQ